MKTNLRFLLYYSIEDFLQFNNSSCLTYRKSKQTERKIFEIRSQQNKFIEFIEFSAVGVQGLRCLALQINNYRTRDTNANVYTRNTQLEIV